MYKTSYVCDCCGKEMTPLPMYTLSLNAQNFCIQDQTSWHYCDDCWNKIKGRLTGYDSENDEKLNKAMDRLKKENERLQNAVNWWSSILIVLINNTIRQEKEKDAKSVTCNCYCENVNKERYLNFKQTMGI